MQDAIVLGGGISGLTAAYLAQSQGLEVSAIEKADHPGGPIASIRKDDFLLEKGPNSLLLPEAWVESFIAELGLEDEVLEPSPSASKRYIIKGGKPVPVPNSPLQAVTTPLFSFKGKLGFLREPFRPRISDEDGVQETVADFVTRRMGPDFLDYAIDPFVNGVYAGDPRKLILEYAFPLMRGFEREGGSIIKGAIAHKRKRKKEGTTYKKRSISFREGLGTLPRALAKKLGNRLWLGSEVTAIKRIEEAWQVTWKKDEETFEGLTKNLLVCLPSYAIKKLSWCDSIASRLHETPDLAYPCVHSLAIGCRREQIEHPLDGFGMLVPNKEPHSILGALFSSSLFPNRAPKDHCLLTVMMGGMRRPGLANTPVEQLKKLALEELRTLVGFKGEPTFFNAVSWPRAIPQYTREFGPWRDTLRSLEAQFPGLHFGGNCVDGIAMGASILSGRNLVQGLQEV